MGFCRNLNLDLGQNHLSTRAIDHAEEIPPKILFTTCIPVLDLQFVAAFANLFSRLEGFSTPVGRYCHSPVIAVESPAHSTFDNLCRPT